MNKMNRADIFVLSAIAPCTIAAFMIPNYLTFWMITATIVLSLAIWFSPVVEWIEKDPRTKKTRSRYS